MVSKQRLDALIPKAMDVLADPVTKLVKEGKISGTYHGYISSFGAMMALSSPLAAARMFEYSEKEQKDKQRTKENKAVITRAILELMRKELGQDRIPATHEQLSQHLVERVREGMTRRDRQDLAAACIALKLAMRSYPKGE